MSTAELIDAIARTLPDLAQAARWQLVALLANEPSAKLRSGIELDSARGLLCMASEQNINR